MIHRIMRYVQWSIAGAAFFSPAFVLAGVITIKNPVSGVNTLFDFIRLVFDTVILPVGAVVVALAIIWSGFLFVTAQGNPQKLGQAQRAFFWSFIGGMVLLGSWVIANGIACTVNQIRGLPCAPTP